jgi:hypothetical protein
MADECVKTNKILNFEIILASLPYRLKVAPALPSTSGYHARAI